MHVDYEIYLSGPMTGLPDHNRPAFNSAADWFTRAGYTVFNPARNGLGDDAPWEDHMRIDISALTKAQTLVMLPGWINSRGAQLEFSIATALGLRVIELRKAVQEFRAKDPAATSPPIKGLAPLSPAVSAAETFAQRQLQLPGLTG